MADKLKKFFKNKKLDSTFKKAGPGYKLSDTATTSASTSTSTSTSASTSESASASTSASTSASASASTSAGPSRARDPPPPVRTGRTEESSRAAEAALARLEEKKRDPFARSSFTAIQAQVKRELAAEKERKLQERQLSHSRTASEEKMKETENEFEASKILAATGVFFKCPLLGPEVLTKDEWYQRIRHFLYGQVPTNKGLTACLILHTLNKSPERVNGCIDIIQKYFLNILGNLDEEKYRKIRISNKVFREKVMPMEGALLLLEAAGFERRMLQHQGGVEEFLVFPEEKLGDAPEIFDMLMDALKSAEPISLELDRNMQILLPREASERSQFPETFYNLTVEDIRREQQLRTEAAEKSQMLRTKAMRERDEMHEKRKYRFGVIRVRFPEEVLLQGTFRVNESFTAVMDYVRSVLQDENTQFSLTTPTGQAVTNESATLQELNLIPASVLNFHADSSQKKYLKPEVMALVQTMPSTEL